MAIADIKQDRASKQKMAERVLSDPDLYPDEFKAWLPRWLNRNVNFAVDTTQLPSVEQWKAVGGTGNAQFSNTWVNFGGSDAVAAYMKDPWDFVHLKGTVKSGTLNSIIFVLPAGYRPQEIENFAVVCNGGFGQITVSPDGSVKQSAGGSVAYITLSGITFRAFS